LFPFGLAPFAGDGPIMACGLAVVNGDPETVGVGD
jgi:hypothetical protein